MIDTSSTESGLWYALLDVTCLWLNAGAWVSIWGLQSLLELIVLHDIDKGQDLTAKIFSLDGTEQHHTGVMHELEVL